MIFGTGIDLADLNRFEKWVNNPSFCERYYAAEELLYIQSKGLYIQQSMAAGFAAKEAFGKALGTGLSGFSLKDIAVLRDAKGKPYFHFEKAIQHRLLSCGTNPRVHLSLSHEGQWAIAQVIIEVDGV